MRSGVCGCSALNAAEWHLDSNRIGVMGFSAGGDLAALLCRHAGDKLLPASGYSAAPDGTDALSAVPSFVLLIYPAYLVEEQNLAALRPEVAPVAGAPPAFLVQAEDDPVHAQNVLEYYSAFMEAKVPAELHVYAKGGHGYGLRPTSDPVTHWPVAAAEWFRTIGVLPRSVTATAH